jgi:hypothetical protein
VQFRGITPFVELAASSIAASKTMRGYLERLRWKFVALDMDSYSLADADFRGDAFGLTYPR